VYESVPVQKQITVQVCSYRQEVRHYNITRCVPECHQESVVKRVPYCVCVPYQSTVRVPVCTTCCSSGCCN